jgi:GT2 family glycosyltransferase
LHPLVSIIVLNYNGAQYLPECIGSVLRSNYPNFEVVVVDNGSHDNSMSILRSLSTNKLKIVECGKNLGFAGGNNIGFKHTTGDYVVFLNNDTRVDPEWLHELVTAVKGDSTIGAAQPKILLLGTSVKKFDSAGDFIDSYATPVSRARGQIDFGQHEKIEEIFSGRGAALLVNRCLFQDMSPFDSDFYLQYEDIDLCWRLRLLGYRILYVPKAIVYHIGFGTKSPYRTYHARKNAIMLLLKNYGSSNLLRYLPRHILIRNLELVNDLIHFNMKDFMVKAKAYLWIMRNLRPLLLRRKMIQMRRIVKEDQLMHLIQIPRFSVYVRYMERLGRMEVGSEEVDLVLNAYFRSFFSALEETRATNNSL